MKKFLSLLITLLLVFVSAFSLSSCKNNDDIQKWSKVRVADSSLYSDEGYINYAEKVYFDTTAYSDLAEEGLFWTKWDEESQKIIEIPADSAEGAALVDPLKPTIINVHGMLGDGNESQEKYICNNRIASPSDYDLETDYIPMNYLWIKQGWNVANFHYNRFASETSPILIESKIWSVKGDRNIRYQKANGDWIDNPTQYSLAEHFAAEYIRAMNLLPDNMGNKEIRIAAHSMGGELTCAGIFLLTELADAGQIKQTKLPVRYANMDGYFCINIGSTYVGPTNLKINWSKKTLNNTGFCAVECIKDISANGIIVEYYSYDDSPLNMVITGQLKQDLQANSVYVIMDPDYQTATNDYRKSNQGHNGVREWYLCSLLRDPVKDVTDAAADKIAACASTPTDILRTFKGVSFRIDNGKSTLNSADDTFIRE